MKESRHRIILQELDQTGVVAVKNLKEMLGVTDMTIRRDLIDLEKQGMLTRVHGGAHKKVKNALNEISHSEKQMLNVEEKKQIARKCADLIADGGYGLYWVRHHNRFYRRLFGWQKYQHRHQFATNF